jgi:hypothetical protein
MTDKDGECDRDTVVYLETTPEFILKESGEPRNISARITDNQFDLNRENPSEIRVHCHFP